MVEYLYHFLLSKLVIFIKVIDVVIWNSGYKVKYILDSFWEVHRLICFCYWIVKDFVTWPKKLSYEPVTCWCYEPVTLDAMWRVHSISRWRVHSLNFLVRLRNHQQLSNKSISNEELLKNYQVYISLARFYSKKVWQTFQYCWVTWSYPRWRVEIHHSR